MKILVFSDSHGNYRPMYKALQAHPDCAFAVYLGDGVEDAEFCFEMLPNIPHIIVSGNREQYRESIRHITIPPYEAFFEKNGVKFLAMHGHTPANVKFGIEPAAKYAHQKGADILLFGHTHQKTDKIVSISEDESIRVINPGSIGAESYVSYAVIEIQKGGVVCGFGG